MKKTPWQFMHAHVASNDAFSRTLSHFDVIYSPAVQLHAANRNVLCCVSGKKLAKMMKSGLRGLFNLYICLAFFYTGQAQVTRLREFKAETIPLADTLVPNTHFHSYKAVHLPSAALAGFLQNKENASLRLSLGSNMSFDLELEPVAITAPGYRLVIQTEHGIQQLSSHPNYFFRGKVKGGGYARLTIKKGFIYGVIKTNSKEYFIEPLRRYDAAASEDGWIVYEPEHLKDANPSCGFSDETAAIKKEVKQAAIEQAPDAICRNVQFVSTADYSVYNRFGHDTEAEETALLSNINLAEGAFTTLNLGPDASVDTGQDRLHFEAKEVWLSTCASCDFIDNTNYIYLMSGQFKKWIAANAPPAGLQINQFWTTRNLYNPGADGVIGTAENSGAGCTAIRMQYLKYYTDAAASIRTLVAHETGHNFGCPHDDNYANVTGFIMYSHAGARNTTFSTLADFGGINFSSHLTLRNTMLQLPACVANCGAATCGDVKNLHVEYFATADSVRVTWEGDGPWLTRYKVSDSAYYDTANLKEVTGNSIVVKHLLSCEEYIFSIQKKCDSNTVGRIAAVSFSPSALYVTPVPVNKRDSFYDLQLSISCRNCAEKQYRVTVDRAPIPFNAGNTSGLVMIPNLYADGARHRIDVWKDSLNSPCGSTTYYQAPYYRENSLPLICAGFNDCKMPGGWKDSVLYKVDPAWADPAWNISNENMYTGRTDAGSIDSTCMIYFNNSALSAATMRGGLALISPEIDVTPFRNIYLHFDYNFLSYQSVVTGYLKAEVFDGNAWVNIFELTATEPYRPAYYFRRVWDSLPPRKFISLDAYKNSHFRIRFSVSDGSQRDASGNIQSALLLAALDNICVDGYPPAAGTGQTFQVFPVPAGSELFIRFGYPVSQDIQYKITDAAGKTVLRGKLIYSRIPIGTVAAGVYFLQLFRDGNAIGPAKKIFKY